MNISQDEKILQQLIKRLARGSSLIEIMSILFEELPQIMPLDRIGIAMLSPDQKYFVSKLNITLDKLHLTKGYQSPSKNSSLFSILENRQGRIINNLPLYLERHPTSVSTRLVVKEGIQSNISTPLFIEENPMGILFLASKEKSSYTQKHLDFAQRISDIASLCLQKATLHKELNLTQTSLNLLLTENEGLVAQSNLETSETPIEPKTWNDWERYIIEKTLSKHQGRIYGDNGAAKQLDLPPTTLQSKMKRLGFSSKKHRKTKQN